MKEEKNRHTIWLTDESWAKVKDHYRTDNCSTQNEYIEKAIQFYPTAPPREPHLSESGPSSVFPRRYPNRPQAVSAAQGKENRHGPQGR